MACKGAHVDFIEGREHSRVLPSFQQSFGNPQANATHGLAGDVFFRAVQAGLGHVSGGTAGAAAVVVLPQVQPRLLGN